MRCSFVERGVLILFFPGKMAGVLSDRFKNGLSLQTKTVGEDRIRRARERNEDIAILSMELPGEKRKFRCSMGEDCLMGDPESLPLGWFLF